MRLLLPLFLMAACAGGDRGPRGAPPARTTGGAAGSPSASPTVRAARGPAAPDDGDGPRIDPPVRLDLGAGQAPVNETSAAASPANPLEVVAAWNDARQGSFRIGAAISLDGGASWSDALLAPPAGGGGVHGDPLTAADPRTGALWAGGVDFTPGQQGLFVARKDPGAAGFRPSVWADQGGGIDKGLLAAGPAPGDPGATRLYAAHKLGLVRSDDLGDSWSARVGWHGASWGHVPRVAPDGTLYVVYWDMAVGIDLVVSRDGGQTLLGPLRAATRLDTWFADTQRFPGRFRVLPTLGFALARGALVVVYPDTTQVVGGQYDVDLYLARSLDGGATWSAPRVILDDEPDIGDQFFPWLEADEEGRLHLVCYDTRRADGVLQSDGSAKKRAWVEAVIAWSDDLGDTWERRRLTEVPMRSDLADPPAGLFVGDYLGLAAAGGRALPVYLDTPAGFAEIDARAVRHGPATSFCFGIACPCGNVDPRAGCARAGGRGARLTARGTASVLADDLELSAEGLPPGAPLVFLAAAGRGSAPLADGRLCLAGPVQRYPPRTADALGGARLGPGEVVRRARAGFPSGARPAAGEAWHYQVWYRDVPGACGAGANLTNALTVDWE